jgi:hypothetical protein
MNICYTKVNECYKLVYNNYLFRILTLIIYYTRPKYGRRKLKKPFY